MVILLKINHDVIIGKRNSNCISCGVPSAGASSTVPPIKDKLLEKVKRGSVDFDARHSSKFESLKHVKGQDGRQYIT